jgi:hypothetical protein
MISRKKKTILEIERESTRSRSVENSLWKKLWPCRKTDCIMNEHKRSVRDYIKEIVFEVLSLSG